MRLAQAYVIIQKYISAYPPEEALRKGTIFPELDLPYKAER
ncbi:spore coat associated protein CotJA [Caldanaerobacter sp.]